MERVTWEIFTCRTYGLSGAIEGHNQKAGHDAKHHVPHGAAGLEADIEYYEVESEVAGGSSTWAASAVSAHFPPRISQSHVRVPGLRLMHRN